jgi:hypothetical protein
MKTYSVLRCTSTSLNFGTRRRWVVSFTLRPLYASGKRPWYLFDEWLGGPWGWSCRWGEEKNIILLGSFSPWLVAVLSELSRKYIYLVLFNDAFSNSDSQLRMMGWCDESWSGSHGIFCLDWLTKSMKNLSEDCRCVGRGSNRLLTNITAWTSFGLLGKILYAFLMFPMHGYRPLLSHSCKSLRSLE